MTYPTGNANVDFFLQELDERISGVHAQAPKTVADRERLAAISVPLRMAALRDPAGFEQHLIETLQRLFPDEARAMTAAEEGLN